MTEISVKTNPFEIKYMSEKYTSNCIRIEVSGQVTIMYTIVQSPKHKYYVICFNVTVIFLYN